MLIEGVVNQQLSINPDGYEQWKQQAVSTYRTYRQQKLNEQMQKLQGSMQVAANQSKQTMDSQQAGQAVLPVPGQK